jgi:hypothetical protein
MNNEISAPLHRHMAASLHDIQIHTSYTTYKLNTMLKIQKRIEVSAYIHSVQWLLVGSGARQATLEMDLGDKNFT